jgi:hypothetical protein
MVYGSNQPPPNRAFLSLFELPPGLIRPAVEACRFFNTVMDKIFYDVPALRAQDDFPTDSFSALADPEGSLLLVDPAASPCIRQFHDVHGFLNSSLEAARDVEIVCITGVGSSALGSAALAWDISKAFAAPVLAIVPGYGVADMVLQGLGGWFGFGMFNAFGAKSTTQAMLAKIAPASARIGRKLAASVPGAETVNDAPVFQYGSGSSDVLHALMEQRAKTFKIAVGHSKGALQIGNGLRSLDGLLTKGMHIVTLGCPIAEEIENANYHQYLGIFDALGQLNMWGNCPSEWVRSWHSTNPFLPPAMAAGTLTRKSV